MVHANSLYCGMPQYRSRIFIFIRGWHKSLASTPTQKRILDAIFPKDVYLHQTHILSILDKEKRDDFDDLSIKQQMNVLQQLDEFAAMNFTNEIGIIDACRDPDRKVDGEITIGHTRTLRTNCTHLWVLPSDDLKSTFGALATIGNQKNNKTDRNHFLV